ncbi:transcriptional regulator [Vagococcus salmoninarum]|uniref:transcriptional regulator n=1 Tax=Vagococcus salmoninarum TaxID=2739 RepID=UPI003F9CB5E7
MELTIIEKIRTNNFTESLVAEKIMTLWQTALNKLSEKPEVIYALYDNYQSDYRGDYDLSIAWSGNQAKGTREINPNKNYHEFLVDPELEQGVFVKWQEIWALEEAGLLVRAYGTDYEKYDNQGNISIFIEIK